MIFTEEEGLTEEQFLFLDSVVNSAEADTQLKYRKYTLLLLIIFLASLLFLIYIFDEAPFTVILKILTVVPVWLIFVVNYNYFIYTRPKISIKRKLKRILQKRKYSVTRIISNRCIELSHAGKKYNGFYVEPNEVAILALNDFFIDHQSFPNDDFAVPEEVVAGFKQFPIVIKGDYLKPLPDPKIKRRLSGFVDLIQERKIMPMSI